MLPLLFALVTLLLQPRGEHLRLVVVGDTGDGSAEVARGIAAVHAAQPVDAIVLTGDNVYPCGVKSPQDPRWSVVRPLTSIGVPIYPVLGNHDYCGNESAQIGAPLAHWNFPAAEYALHAGAIADLFFLDTTPIAAGKRGPPELQFGDAAWRIAIGHHTIVSSGYHGYLPRSEHHAMERLVAPMRKAGVDLYLCGHDHHLELLRTNPLMLVSGAGSDPIMPVMRHRTTMFPDAAEAFRGFAVVDLTVNMLTIRFYDAAGKPRSAEFRFAKQRQELTPVTRR